MGLSYEHIWIGGLPFLKKAGGSRTVIIVPGFGESARTILDYALDDGAEWYVCAFYDLRPLRSLGIVETEIYEYFEKKKSLKVVGNSLGTGVAYQIARVLKCPYHAICPNFLQESFWIKTIVKRKRRGVLLLRAAHFLSRRMSRFGWKKGVFIHKSIAKYGPEGMWNAWSFFSSVGKPDVNHSNTSVYISPKDDLIDETQVRKAAKKKGWAIEILDAPHHKALKAYLLM